MNDTGAHPDPLRGQHLGHAKGFSYTARTDQYTLAMDLKPATLGRTG